MVCCFRRSFVFHDSPCCFDHSSETRRLVVELTMTSRRTRPNYSNESKMVSRRSFTEISHIVDVSGEFDRVFDHVISFSSGLDHVFAYSIPHSIVSTTSLDTPSCG